MATGYTWPVKDGTAKTLGQYLRKFFNEGMVDTGLKLDPHYPQRVADAEKRLAEVRNMTREEAQREIDENFAKNSRYREESIQETKQTLERFNAMLLKVRAWDTEGNRVCEDIKKYAISQLEDSIRWEGEPGAGWDTAKDTVEEFLADELEWAERDLKNARDALAEHEKMVADGNEAIRILKKLA